MFLFFQGSEEPIFVLTLWKCYLQVLAELKEYATEVDVDFVRKAVRAIGRCAIKVEVRDVIVLCKYQLRCLQAIY